MDTQIDFEAFETAPFIIDEITSDSDSDSGTDAGYNSFDKDYLLPIYAKKCERCKCANNDNVEQGC